MNLLFMISRRFALGTCAIAALAACSSAWAAEKAFTLGGSISGLRGTGLVLSNGSHTATINTNGRFAFSTPLPSGTSYNVTVVTRPSQPTQGCLILNGRGTITANVTNVSLACVTSSFTVGGVVTGLSGSGLVLRNGTQTLAVNASGTFAFPTPVLSGAGYAVTVEAQPAAPAQRCTVSDGSGTIGAGNVANVVVTCTTLPPLRLMSSAPAPEATGVSRTDPLVLNFSAPLNAQTVDTTRLSLGAENTFPQLALSVSGPQIALTPSMQLLPSTPYTMLVRYGVQGSEGESLASDLTVNFTTRETSWRTSQVLSFGSSAVAAASISGRGENFAAVWRHENDSIALRRYSPRTGWSDLTILDRNTRAFVNDPQVFLDVEGTAHVIYNNNTQALEYSRHTPEGGWSPVEQIVPPGNDYRIGTWRAGADAGGNVIVVWTHITGENSGASDYEVRAMRYARRVGWSAPVLLSDTNHFATEPRLAVHADLGSAVAIWQELRYSGSSYQYQLWSKRYASSVGWGAARRVDVGGTISAQDAQVALDTQGKATVVYTRGGNVVVNSDGFTTGWSTPLDIQVSAGTSRTPQIAFDRSGKAFASWIQRTANGSYELWRESCPANFPPFNCWTGAERVAVATREFQDLRLAVDSSGSETLVVTDVTATASGVLAFRNVPGSGWIGQPLGYSPDVLSRDKPQLAADESGSTLAIWFSRSADVLAVKASVCE